MALLTGLLYRQMFILICVTHSCWLVRSGTLEWLETRLLMVVSRTVGREDHVRVMNQGGLLSTKQSELAVHSHQSLRLHLMALPSHEVSAHVLAHPIWSRGRSLFKTSGHTREQRVAPDARKTVLLPQILRLREAWHVHSGLLALKIDHLNFRLLMRHTHVHWPLGRCHRSSWVAALLVGADLGMRLEITLIDWLRVGDHEMLLLLSRLSLFVKTECVVDCISHSLLKNLLQVLLRRSLLNLRQLLLAQDSLTHVKSVHVTPVAEVAEAEVEVIAVEAEPVTDSLRQHPLLTSWLGLGPIELGMGGAAARVILM